MTALCLRIVRWCQNLLSVDDALEQLTSEANCISSNAASSAARLSERDDSAALFHMD